MNARLLATLAPAALSLVLTIVGLVLFGMTPQERAPVGLRFVETIPLLGIQVSSAVVGLVVSWRHPTNLVGWLMSIGGVNASIMYLAAGYMTYGLFSDAGLPLANVVGWFWGWGGMLLAIPLQPIVFLFPDGRLRSRADRIGVVFGLLAWTLAAPVVALRPGPLMGFPFAQNPFGWVAGGRLLDVAMILPLTLLFVSFLLAVRSLRERAEHGSALERQQVKWLSVSVVLFMVVYAFALPALFTGVLGVSVDPLIAFLGRLAGGLAIGLLPIAIGIAILRYRLYDIDLFIKRTVVYGATSAAIGAGFFVGIIALQPLLRPLTSGTELAVAVSTLVSFALFQPIRRRVQDIVDRRFDRSRYDAARIVDAFADELRDEVDLDDLRAGLMAAVEHTMLPTHASLWLKERVS
ncbi:MAG TPA: hypothetical protein VNE19_08435 [Methylomirabilota bacterium]|nr:hypothetical protein [Methylomirabilota bacterium]